MITQSYAPLLRLGLAAALVVALVVPSVTTAATMCTQEAKQCPDGSWVGRTGPNCEFVCGAVPQTPSAPVGTFEGDDSMADDMTPIFSVTSGVETVLPPDEGFLWGIVSWFRHITPWFW